MLSNASPFASTIWHFITRPANNLKRTKESTLHSFPFNSNPMHRLDPLQSFAILFHFRYSKLRPIVGHRFWNIARLSGCFQKRQNISVFQRSSPQHSRLNLFIWCIYCACNAVGAVWCARAARWFSNFIWSQFGWTAKAIFGYEATCWAFSSQPKKTSSTWNRRRCSTTGGVHWPLASILSRK